MRGALQLATAVPGVILAAVLRRMNDQRPAAVAASLMSAVAMIGLMLAPALALPWSVVPGFGCGASMIPGVTFIGMPATNAKHSAALRRASVIAVLGAWTGLQAGRKVQIGAA